MPKVPLPYEKEMDPIPEKHRRNMEMIMETLTEAFPGVGLCLFLFDENAGQPRANYIANTASRSQTLLAIKEFVTRQEAILATSSSKD